MMLLKPSSQVTFVPQKDARQRDDFHTLSIDGDHRIVDTSSTGRRPRLVVERRDVSEENASDRLIRKSHTARSFRHWIVSVGLSRQYVESPWHNNTAAVLTASALVVTLRLSVCNSGGDGA
jgi:hypothetical protein